MPETGREVPSVPLPCGVAEHDIALLVHRDDGGAPVIVDGEVLVRNEEYQPHDKAEIIGRFKESLSRPLTDRELARGALSRRLLPRIHTWFEDWPLEDGAPHYSYNRAE